MLNRLDPYSYLNSILKVLPYFETVEDFEKLLPWCRTVAYHLRRWPKRLSWSNHWYLPKAKIQLCIVHLVEHSLKFFPCKDYNEVTKNLKLIYQSGTEDKANLERERSAEKRHKKYPQISKSWPSNGHNLITIFSYPRDIHKVIYTTNAIESLNSVIRKSVKTLKIMLL